MTTPAAPQSATPPAPTTGPADSQPAATPPVPGPPPSAPAQQPASQQAPATTTPPAADAGKTFTQADLDRIINERLDKQQTAFRKQFAQALGIEDPNAAPDPAKVVEESQQRVTAAEQRADLADARSLAALAGVSKDHVDLFLKLVDLGPLKTVDRSDSAAVSATIKAQVDAALAAAPMFKGSTLPAASGGDRQGVGQPSLDEQIAAAQKNGDHATAIALKRQKLYTTGG